MRKKKYVVKPLNFFPAWDIEGFDKLAALALDMRWSWNHATDEIWRQIDPDLWEYTHNPWGMLQTVSRDKLVHVLADPVIRKQIDGLIVKQTASEAPTWFQQSYANSSLTCIAYFCMEFMLSEALPIYSGGLGNVAGDQLKAASDLGVPVVGIGLLYQQGYFRQVINKEGAQEAFFPYNDFGQLPIRAVYCPNGEWLRLQLNLSGLSIWLRVWQVQVGSVKLYLLDSNDAANFPPYRGITSELYGGDLNTRLLQELVLGIGGWRLLVALGIEPEVCHLNEGHAAFAVLERARSFMIKTGQTFAAALAVIRAGNLFTTHTAVNAGFDRFEPSLIEEYLAEYATQQLGISVHELLALGRQDPSNKTENFNMAYLAIRGSGAVNGVSRLHSKVSQHLFAPLFFGWPINEVPVAFVTNGVHIPSWDSAAADRLWTKACGKKRWRGKIEGLEKRIRKLSDEAIWQFRNDASQSFINFVRERLAIACSSSYETKKNLQQAKQLFNPNALTLGFARRFATYKRPNLLLHNRERLLRLLSNPERPVQLILAGKAHPADLPGQALIQEWIHFIRKPEVSKHIIFLSDHDMLLTEQFVQGVDVWINTPRRPWEACGTSGMKVLVNGGINLSELDGWWAEAYTSEVGWALGDGKEHTDEAAWDAKEAEELYDLLENEVIPKFYTRNQKNIPTAWITMMRESMGKLTPEFSTNRVVRQYVEEHYLPAAKAYNKRAKDKGVMGEKIVNWQHTLDQKWSALRLGELKIATQDKQHLLQIEVYLNDLDPEAVRVALYANEQKDAKPVCLEMLQLQPIDGILGGYIYSASVPDTQAASDYTVRIIPYYPDVSVPLEDTHILWQMAAPTHEKNRV